MDKDKLLKVLITKICKDESYPDLRYEDWFYGSYAGLLKYIGERKGDVPSLQYISEHFGFEKQESEYTLTDIMEELDSYYAKERITQILEQVVPEIRKKGNGDIRAVLDKVNSEFNKTRSVITKTERIDLRENIDKIKEKYINIGNGGSLVSTGFDRFDDIIHPMTGQFMLLCAGTGVGKSNSAIRMYTHAMMNGIPSIYFSLEMGLIEMTNRILAAAGKFDFYDMLFNRIDPDDYEKALLEINTTQSMIVTREEESRIDISTVENYIKEFKPKMVFIDYLTLLDGCDFSWNSENAPTTQLKRIALSNDSFITALLQADTEANKSGEIPTHLDTRGNKGFGHDCNIFLGMSAQEYETEPGRYKYHYAVSKSRNGGLPRFSYRVRLSKGEWQDATGEEF